MVSVAALVSVYYCLYGAAAVVLVIVLTWEKKWVIQLIEVKKKYIYNEIIIN